MGRDVRAYIELTAAMAIVGSATVVGKVVISSFPIFLALELRFLFALAVLLPLLARSGGLRPIARRDAVALLLQAITGVLLLNVLLLYGLTWTGAAEGGIVRSALPALTAVAAFAVLKERPTSLKVVGIAVIVLGILAMNALAAGEAERGPDPLLGNLLILAAVVSEAFFTIFGKLAAKGVGTLPMSTLLAVFGALVFLPFAAVDAAGFDFSGVTLGAWLWLAYYGIGLTVVAVFLWFRGVSKVPASTAAGFMGVLPISAVLLSYAVLGEAFAWSHLIGVACVLLGVALITRAAPAPQTA